MIYLSYFLGNLAILAARVRGWPKTRAPFRLGRWGVAINVLGLLYGGGMLVNFAWPRLASNPEPKQTVSPAQLNFHVGFLNDIPILWTVAIFIALVGGLYYVITGRHKEFVPVIVPAEEEAASAGGAA